MATFEMDEAALVHYGVKGMKWGVRRQRGANGLVGGRTRQGYVNRQNRKADRKTARAEKRVKKIEKRVEEYKKGVRSAEQMFNRLESGKATTADVLVYTASVNIGDVVAAAVNRRSVKTQYIETRRTNAKTLKRNADQALSRAKKRGDRRKAKADELRQHAQRLDEGKATTGDMLKYFGTVNLRDTVRA